MDRGSEARMLLQYAFICLYANKDHANNRYSQLYLEHLSRFGRMRVLSRDDQWLRGGIKGSGSSGINRVKSRCG